MRSARSRSDSGSTLSSSEFMSSWLSGSYFHPYVFTWYPLAIPWLATARACSMRACVFRRQELVDIAMLNIDRRMWPQSCLRKSGKCRLIGAKPELIDESIDPIPVDLIVGRRDTVNLGETTRQADVQGISREACTVPIRCLWQRIAWSAHLQMHREWPRWPIPKLPLRHAQPG